MNVIRQLTTNTDSNINACVFVHSLMLLWKMCVSSWESNNSIVQSYDTTQNFWHFMLNQEFSCWIVFWVVRRLKNVKKSETKSLGFKSSKIQKCSFHLPVCSISFFIIKGKIYKMFNNIDVRLRDAYFSKHLNIFKRSSFYNIHKSHQLLLPRINIKIK